MTDNEIIKALECCSKSGMINCRQCPYEESCNSGKSDMQKDALGLINRQKDTLKLYSCYKEPFVKQIKSEAAKEFAERLKRYATSICSGHGMSSDVVYVGYINEVVKEMTGEKT